MMAKADVQRWINTLADDAGIAVDDGGLTLVEVLPDGQTYGRLEIGGVPLQPRFTVVEYSGHYSVRDNESGEERVMGDGVDTLFKPDGEAMTPGSEEFRKAWEESLNANESETEEAYFRQ